MKNYLTGEVTRYASSVQFLLEIERSAFRRPGQGARGHPECTNCGGYCGDNDLCRTSMAFIMHSSLVEGSKTKSRWASD